MNMVKKLAIATAFLCAVTVVNAQDMKFGVRAGYNIQSISKGDSDEAPEMGMLGVSIGAVANIPAGPVVIAPELAFIYRTLSSEKEGDVEFSLTEMAISIPIMVKFFPMEGLFLQAGVKLDIPLGTKSCVEYDGDEECTDWDGKETTVSLLGMTYTEKNPERTTIDIGIPLGLGYMITPELGVDFRYVLGISKLINDDDNDSGSLSTFGIGVTYLF
jgi:hypothetical protein